MNDASHQIISLLKQRHPGQVLFRRKLVNDAAVSLGFTRPADYIEILELPYRIRKGTYDYTSLITGAPQPQIVAAPEPVQPVRAPLIPSVSTMAMSTGVSTVTAEMTYVPTRDPHYVRWGSYADIAQIISSRLFYPIYIAGLSGNGKTVMVEQACANLNREYIRVQISPETDEDDLIGGFRLVNGETVFAKGPVVQAMERGAVLLIDELDRSSNKIMCLQGVLEGKPILIKKTGELIRPAPGFNVIATANTKGRGSDDGKFSAATIIDEAFLERFVATIDQPYPTPAVEKKIVLKHMEKYGMIDESFADKLVTWSDVIRKTFKDGGVDEVISTRRLCHIAQTFAIFKDRLVSIDMCISRFDGETRTAFSELYKKIDAQQNVSADAPATTSNRNNEPPF